MPAKLADIERPVRSLDQLAAWPFTYKTDLLGSPHGHDLAANRTWPVERYARLHRTSGTHGRPLVVLDTAEDWQWWIDCWQYVLDAAEVTSDDCALMAFSFGPFIGFWSAYDALAARGCLLVPTGGVSTLGRLELARTSQATVICCTPSYALHLAEVAADNKFDVASLGVRRIIVAGEPGGSVAAVRARIEALWNAKVIDHCGATEVGPWGYGDLAGAGVSVNESQFIAEFLSVATGTPAAEGELAELVLTTLGRYGSPTIRYRTGDLVRPLWHGEGPSRFVRLDGGILGPHRRHAGRSRREHFSEFDRADRSQLSGGRRISRDRVQSGASRSASRGSRRSAERPGSNRTGTSTAAGDERRGPTRAARIAAALRRKGKAVHRPRMTDPCYAAGSDS